MYLRKINSTATLKCTLLGAIALAILATTGGTAAARDKYETIDAQAFGTGTQLGQNIGVTLNIYEFSSPADGRLFCKPTRKVRTKDSQLHFRR